MFSKNRMRGLLPLLILLMLSIASGSASAAPFMPSGFKAALSELNPQNGYTVTLSWHVTLFAENYRLEKATGPQGPWYEMFDTTQTTAGEGGVWCDMKRYYRLYAVDAYGNLSTPAYAQAIIPACSTPPNAPMIHKVQLETPTSIRIEWYDVWDEDVYFLEYNDGGIWIKLADVPANKTFAIHSSLKCGTLYKYRLIAYNNFGYSNFSHSKSATTGACPSAPAQPVITSVTVFDKTSVKITWNDLPDETAFVVLHSTSQVSWFVNPPLPANTTTYTYAALPCGSTWHFKVRASNDLGDSPASEIKSVTTDACQHPPAAPSNLKAAATGQTTINLTWDDLAIETKYHVEGSADGKTWQPLITLGLNTTSYTQGGLNCNTKRYYRLRAENQYGKSSYSAVASATTHKCGEVKPPQPVELVYNGNFETNVDDNAQRPDGWDGPGALKGDKVINTGGTNEFQLKGTPKQASRITQMLNLSGKTLKQGDTVRLAAAIKQGNGKPNAVIVKAIITFVNGQKQVMELRLAQQPAAGWASFSRKTTLLHDGVASIQVNVQYMHAVGTVLVDNVSLTATPPVALGAGEPVPAAPGAPGWIELPAAPGELRGSGS